MLAREDMRLAMGFMYQDLSDYSRAEAAFRGARESYVALHVPVNRGVAACTFGLALVRLHQGQYKEAELTARSAAALGRRVFGTNDTVVVHSLNCMAAALEAQNKLGEAEDCCREAIVIEEKYAGDEALTVAYSLSTLGKVLLKQGKPTEAEPILGKALELRRGVLGNAHPQVAELLMVLAGVLDRQGTVREAESVSSEAKRILEGKTRAPSK